MERNGQSGALTNFFLLLLAGILSFSISRFTPTYTGHLTSFILGFAVLVAIVSWFQMRLEEQERLEQLEFDEITRTRGGTSLFNTAESETFPARRSREMFERFFVPIFSGLFAVGQATVAFLCWRWLDTVAPGPTKQPLLALGLFGGQFIVLFLIGQYSTGVAKLESRRLLRPSGNLMLLGAYLCAVTAAVLGAVFAEFPRVDILAAKGVTLLLAILALEGLVSVVFDIYRPRLKGKVSHPLYDSRLVGLISHPEGVFSTAASALDYQFGFKVSDTWFYQFLRTNLVWLILGQVGLLLICTGVVLINPGEQALLERLGRPVAGREVLNPGLHFKLPWPIDDVRRFRTEQIQSFVVGSIPDDSKKVEIAYLWSIKHFKEEINLLVPSATLATDVAAGQPGVSTNIPLSFLTVSIPIHYQISDLPAYAYNFEDSAKVLEQVANEEVVRYFAQTEVQELLSRGQTVAADVLRKNIQSRVDTLKLGVRLLFVGLQDIHPPAEVVAAYEEVVSARQGVETNRLDALAFAETTNLFARAESSRVIAEEGARSTNRAVEAMARAARFTNQIAAYTASPNVYRHRMFLQAYTNGVAGSRKVIVASTNLSQVIQYDLQERFSKDLLQQLSPTRKP